MPFAATRMDLEMIILREVSQTKKDKYYMISFMWNLKNNTNESIYKTKQTHRQRKQAYGGKGGGGGIQEYRINRFTLLYIKQKSNKDLPYNTGNNIQYLVITYNGK